MRLLSPNPEVPVKLPKTLGQLGLGVVSAAVECAARVSAVDAEAPLDCCGVFRGATVSMPAAVQRSTICPSRQRVTLRLVVRAMEIIDSSGYWW
jgi:hypothetical protein